MKILKISFALMLLLIVSNIQVSAQHSTLDASGCMDSRSCGFSMCIQPYEGAEASEGQECLLVEVTAPSPQDIFIRSDSDDYEEFNNVTFASMVICYDISEDEDIHEDGEVFIRCGIFRYSSDGGGPGVFCQDGCIVIVDGE